MARGNKSSKKSSKKSDKKCDKKLNNNDEELEAWLTGPDPLPNVDSVVRQRELLREAMGLEHMLTDAQVELAAKQNAEFVGAMKGSYLALLHDRWSSFEAAANEDRDVVAQVKKDAWHREHQAYKENCRGYRQKAVPADRAYHFNEVLPNPPESYLPRDSLKCSEYEVLQSFRNTPESRRFWKLVADDFTLAQSLGYVHQFEDWIVLQGQELGDEAVRIIHKLNQQYNLSLVFSTGKELDLYCK